MVATRTSSQTCSARSSIMTATSTLITLHGRMLFFNDKWWRKDAASGASELRHDYIRHLRQHGNNIWTPLSDAEDNNSARVSITFHSLDTLVWEFITSETAMRKDHFNFADIYRCFTRCPLLAFKRAHSTSGAPSQRRRKEKQGKGQPAAAATGTGKGKRQPAAAGKGKGKWMGTR